MPKCLGLMQIVVLRDLEIKAVTSHELQISELVGGEVYVSPDDNDTRIAWACLGWKCYF